MRVVEKQLADVPTGGAAPRPPDRRQTSQTPPRGSLSGDWGLDLEFDLPPGVVALAVPLDDYPLPPEEADCVRTASAKRRRQFASGRHAARTALGRLHGGERPVLRAGRRPLWPEGFVGSISHSDALAAAAVAEGHALRGIGIDLERIDRLGPLLRRRVLTANERRRPWPDSRQGVLAFSAKEAGYKAVNPITGAYIALQQAEVDVDWRRRAFRLRYLGGHEANGLLNQGVGVFRFLNNQVVTLFLLE